MIMNNKVKTMIIKDYNLEGKQLTVFDNVFSFRERLDLYNFFTSGLFKFSGTSNSELNANHKEYIQSAYSPEDLENSRFFSPNLVNILSKYIENKSITRSYVFSSNFLNKHYFHVDPVGLTLLYYANLNWSLNDGGETLFTNDSIDEVLYTSLFKPGRIILFDSSIPHKSNSIPVSTTSFRFSFVVNFE